MSMESPSEKVPEKEGLRPQKTRIPHYHAHNDLLASTLPRIFDRVDNDELYQGIAETALPPIKLHLFNYLSTHPAATDEECKQELSSMVYLSELEEKTRQPDNLLPTIGVEVETLNNKKMFKRIESILNRLDVHHDPVSTNDNRKKFLEINPQFSYHARTVARTLQELTIMNAIRVEKKANDTHPRIPANDSIPLHINFGLPPGVTNKIAITFAPQKHLVIDMLIAAFVSPNRIANREFSETFNIPNDAAPSKKNDPLDENMRIEIRPFEFRDYPTFRLLIEAQRIMAMFIAFVRINSALPRNEKERALGELFSDFEAESRNILEHYRLQENSARIKPMDLVAALQTPEFQKKCRSIINHYSRAVAAILHEED